MRFFSLLSLLLFVPLLQAQPINSFSIDSFNLAGGTANDNSSDGSGVWTGLNPGPTVLGSYRVIGNFITEAPLSTFYSATNIGSGVYSITNSAVTRSVGQVIWQGSDATPGNDAIIAHPASFSLGSLDFDTLLSSPNFNFQWSVVNADYRNWEYTVRAYTENAANYYEAVLVSDQSGVLLSLPKSAFIAVGSPDWSNVDAVSFSTTHNDGLMGGDLAIDNVTLVVPEVSSYLLLAATVVAAGCYYLLRRNNLDCAERPTQEHA